MIYYYSNIKENLPENVSVKGVILQWMCHIIFTFKTTSLLCSGLVSV